MDPIKLYLFMLPVFFAAIALEAVYYRVALAKPYGWKVTGSNLVVALGRLGTDAFTKAIVAAVYVGAYQLRPFDIPMDRWESWVALFFAVELAYYWLHRFSHEIRWMWTQHSVHHSARQITLSVAYRLGWTQFLAGPWLFLVPVCWIGFDPRAVVLMYAANLLYQFWLHTEVVPKLGPFERVFNTPSHHRGDGAEAGSLVIADRQVSGRGRLGRAWHNPSGVAIAMSVILNPLPENISQISMLAALSVVDTLEAFAVKGVAIKWPNDIRISGKKVGGILPEAIWEGERLVGVVLGIGLNVTTDFEDSELATLATSIAHALGCPIDRADICRRLVDQIEFWASKLGQLSFLRHGKIGWRH
jgi:biotin-[acetyl-CoA-carboxylase] ligase BirA-like protein